MYIISPYCQNPLGDHRLSSQNVFLLHTSFLYGGRILYYWFYTVGSLKLPQTKPDLMQELSWLNMSAFSHTCWLLKDL